MNGKVTAPMDKVDMIYEIVKGVRADLTAHIEKEKVRDEKFYEKLAELKTGHALTKQREGAINAGISAIVAGAVAWFVLKFGGGAP